MITASTTIMGNSTGKGGVDVRVDIPISIFLIPPLNNLLPPHYEIKHCPPPAPPRPLRP